ncbi:ribonuclease D [Leptospira kobayashii]|uniref:Ribonuclease D n=2 Tax=Leptospira TaxID=171 RepID=A0A4R9LM33_9LEPT|nr:MULTISPECIES: ribonuclease D [Leptospira]TGN07048.1 ribonuclease D [Leptospira ilyithenensis]BDA79857.1 ribonuclease D [Leptospira kobayashii]
MTQKRSSIKPVVFQGDLSDEFFDAFKKDDRLAVDCEMMGLNPRRDRLCVVQIGDSKNRVALVQILPGQKDAPKIQKLFESKDIVKVFHFARMDLTFLRARLGIKVQSVFCTKIGSKLARTYTDKHGLKELIREFFEENIDKKNQSSDWGKKILTKDQVDYASTDVRFLISLEQILTEMMIRENRFEIAQKCFNFLETQVELDLLEVPNLFEH